MAYSFSPLRYPGGKSRLANFIKLTLKLNGLEGGVYVEPFAGGAGVALLLLLENKVSRIMINDLDPAVHAFWFAVLNYPEELCEIIHKTPVTIDNWYKQREIFNRRDSNNSLELGFATFFLNRTNRSGILKGGVIGGLKQTGNWKIDARYPKHKLIENIQSVSHHKGRIILANLDARDFIRRYQQQFNSNTLLYLDPPYFHKGQKLYHNALESDDHALIANTVLRELQTHWIVSYDDTVEISQLYPNNRQATYPLNYTAARRYHGSEIMIYSNSLQVPDVDNPFRIRKDEFLRQYRELSTPNSTLSQG
ncbi:DNA adenine methylase [bacterium]|nr:DNA adenine methylase [bacterium]